MCFVALISLSNRGTEKQEVRTLLRQYYLNVVMRTHSICTPEATHLKRSITSVGLGCFRIKVILRDKPSSNYYNIGFPNKEPSPQPSGVHLGPRRGSWGPFSLYSQWDSWAANFEDGATDTSQEPASIQLSPHSLNLCLFCWYWHIPGPLSFRMLIHPESICWR